MHATGAPENICLKRKDGSSPENATQRRQNWQGCVKNGGDDIIFVPHAKAIKRA